MIAVIDVLGGERTIEQTVCTHEAVFVSTRLINVGQTFGILDGLDHIKRVITGANTAARRAENFA
jgi:hypothetical protein